MELVTGRDGCLAEVLSGPGNEALRFAFRQRMSRAAGESKVYDSKSPDGPPLTVPHGQRRTGDRRCPDSGIDCAKEQADAKQELAKHCRLFGCPPNLEGDPNVGREGRGPEGD